MADQILFGTAQAHARGVATGHVLAYGATPGRSMALALGAVLTFVTALSGVAQAHPLGDARPFPTFPALAGVAQSHPAAVGSLASSINTPLSGKAVALPRAVATGMHLFYPASPSRGVSRSSGFLTAVGVTGLEGVAQAHPVGQAATLVQGMPLAGTAMAHPAAYALPLGPITPLAGRSRATAVGWASSISVSHGAVPAMAHASAYGQITINAPPGMAGIAQAHPVGQSVLLTTTHSAAEAMAHASAFGQVRIVHRLEGRADAHPRAIGFLSVGGAVLAGTSRAGFAIAYGQLALVSAPLEGRAVAHAQAQGATLAQDVALSGTALSVPRALPAIPTLFAGGVQPVRGVAMAHPLARGRLGAAFALKVEVLSAYGLEIEDLGGFTFDVDVESAERLFVEDMA